MVLLLEIHIRVSGHHDNKDVMKLAQSFLKVLKTAASHSRVLPDALQSALPLLRATEVTEHDRKRRERMEPAAGDDVRRSDAARGARETQTEVDEREESDADDVSVADQARFDPSSQSVSYNNYYS